MAPRGASISISATRPTSTNRIGPGRTIITPTYIPGHITGTDRIILGAGTTHGLGMGLGTAPAAIGDGIAPGTMTTTGTTITPSIRAVAAEADGPSRVPRTVIPAIRPPVTTGVPVRA